MELPFPIIMVSQFPSSILCSGTWGLRPCKVHLFPRLLCWGASVRLCQMIGTSGEHGAGGQRKGPPSSCLVLSPLSQHWQLACVHGLMALHTDILKPAKKSLLRVAKTAPIAGKVASSGSPPTLGGAEGWMLTPAALSRSWAWCLSP